MLQEKIRAVKLAIKYLNKGKCSSIRMYVSHVLTCKVTDTLQGEYLIRYDKWNKQQRKTLVQSI